MSYSNYSDYLKYRNCCLNQGPAGPAGATGPAGSTGTADITPITISNEMYVGIHIPNPTESLEVSGNVKIINEDFSRNDRSTWNNGKLDVSGVATFEGSLTYCAGFGLATLDDLSNNISPTSYVAVDVVGNMRTQLVNSGFGNLGGILGLGGVTNDEMFSHTFPSGDGLGIKLDVSGNTKLRGNVGIGTDPSSSYMTTIFKDDVSANNYIDLELLDQNVLLLKTKAITGISGATDLTFQTFDSTDTKLASSAFVLEPSGNSYAQNIYIHTGSGDITNSDKVIGWTNDHHTYIYTSTDVSGSVIIDGSLGVNVSNPTESLEVSGNTKIQGNAGIGTDPSTNYTLTVSGDVHITGKQIVEQGFHTEMYIYDASSINGTALLDYSANGTINYGSSSPILIDSSGLINFTAIQNHSIDYFLEIYTYVDVSANDAVIRFDLSGQNISGGLDIVGIDTRSVGVVKPETPVSFGASVNKIAITSTPTGDIYIHKNNTYKLRYNSDKNTDIGPTRLVLKLIPTL